VPQPTSAAWAAQLSADPLGAQEIVSMNVPPELRPYFEFTFINGFAICDFCGFEQDAVSKAWQFTDEWYLDLAVTIRTAGWIIPERQVGACPSCAVRRGLRHDPSAFVA
jgi:hypothetical protein